MGKGKLLRFLSHWSTVRAPGSGRRPRTTASRTSRRSAARPGGEDADTRCTTIDCRRNRLYAFRPIDARQSIVDLSGESGYRFHAADVVVVAPPVARRNVPALGREQPQPRLPVEGAVDDVRQEPAGDRQYFIFRLIDKIRLSTNRQ